MQTAPTMQTRESSAVPQQIESYHYYLSEYTVPYDVNNDALLNAGSSMVITFRYVGLSQEKMKILCDDVYLPPATKLSGEWPHQKIVHTTYEANSTAYYNDPLSLDYRGETFELTSSYMHAMQRLPNKRSGPNIESLSKNKKSITII